MIKYNELIFMELVRKVLQAVDNFQKENWMLSYSFSVQSYQQKHKITVFIRNTRKNTAIHFPITERDAECVEKIFLENTNKVLSINTDWRKNETGN